MTEELKVIKIFSLYENSWWGINSWIAKVILEALREFKAKPRNGYPSALESDGEHLDVSEERSNELQAEWEAILDAMIAGFEILATYDIMTPKFQMDLGEEALLLFAIWFVHLWD